MLGDKLPSDKIAAYRRLLALQAANKSQRSNKYYLIFSRVFSKEHNMSET
jgi:hypothetical protein